MAGELVYFVIPVADAGRAQGFYGALFDWRFADGNVPGGYHITNAVPPGGLHAGGGGSAPRVYFSVDDIEAAVVQIRELGGKAGEVHSGSAGAYVNCEDDQGTQFSLFQGP